MDTQHLNAHEVGERYAVDSELLRFLPESQVFVGIITISQTIPLQNNASDRVTVRYRQGSRQVLSLLLDLSNQ